MTPQIASARITRQLKIAEDQVDRALLEYSKLMTEILQARRETGAEPSAGQDALMRLARAQVSAIESGNDLLRVHESLYNLGREYGLLEEKKASAQAQSTEGDRKIAA